MKGQVHGGIDQLKSGRMEGKKNESINEWMKRWMDGLKDEGMDG